MSEATPVSPRKGSVPASLTGAEPKRKSKGKSKGPKSSKVENLPFMEADEFSDVTIIIDEKRLYFNKCLLCYNSPVLRKQLTADDGGSSGKGAKSTGNKPSKDLDMSDKRFDDVCELLAFMDPRVETALSDQDCFRLLPLAEEFDMKPLMKSCEVTLTNSFAGIRRGRKPGSVATDVTIANLAIADKYHFPVLQEMCMEELVANDNPFSGKVIADNVDLSEHVKRQVLERKLEKVNMALARERRINTEREQPRDSKGGKIWKK
ncbi:uncharacterized protein LOC127860529 [Dreissena polymorpha]|nr:uncharacterized protein LOC127860529 [Dreissena polymorpha]